MGLSCVRRELTLSDDSLTLRQRMRELVKQKLSSHHSSVHFYHHLYRRKTDQTSTLCLFSTKQHTLIFFHLHNSQWFHFSMKTNLKHARNINSIIMHQINCCFTVKQFVTADWKSFAVHHKSTEQKTATSSTSTLAHYAIGSTIMTFPVALWEL